MERMLYLLRALGISFLLAFSTLLAFGQKDASRNYVPGEVLIKFSAGVASKEAAAANRTVGSTVLDTPGNAGWQRVRLPQGLDVEQGIQKYKKLNGVQFVQPNFRYKLHVTPNDAQFSNAGLYGLSKISAPSAWELTTGSSAVVVANIDTGMRMTHEDLAANIWINEGEIAGNGIDDDSNGFIDDVNGWDFFFNDSNPTDEHGHGTHTGGTIGAVGNNLVGVAGVNWNVKIMNIKIYDATGFGSTSAMLVSAYSYIRMMKLSGVNIRVTNNSYGGCDEACDYDQATKDGIDAMGEAGILNVFSAGNDSSNIDNTPSYPVSYTSPSIVGVASSTNTDVRSGFSNFGIVGVDLAAPGSGVYSTTYSSNSTYGTKSGTSMAGPHVTGAAALLSAYNPDLSVASLKATLLNTVDPLAAWTTIVRTGGRLNVDQALRNQTVCTFSPDLSTMTVPTKGGIFTMNISAATNCDYSVKSDSKWITVMSSDTMSGNESISFRVGVNPTITRSGTIKIGDSFFTVSQSRK